MTQADQPVPAGDASLAASPSAGDGTPAPAPARNVTGRGASVAAPKPAAVTLRRAQSGNDIALVADMWTRSAAWLRARGSDQWQYPVKMENIHAAVAAGNCWLAQRSELTIGTITVDTNAEPQLWPPEDHPEDALYIHRMVVEETERGNELGSAMLDWAGERAISAGRHWIRLDAWRSNVELHRYYLARGFEFVRMVADPSGSGACFERPATIHLGRGPCITTIL